MVMAVLAVTALSACEKMVVDEEETESGKKGNVTLKATMFNIVPFETRAVQNIADYCSRLCFVVYDSSGSKVKGVSQKKGDTGYGQVSMTLEPATYKLLVLAHSGQSNPTLTDPSFLQFTNQMGYSDTFYYYGDLIVTEEAATHELQLQRATTLLSLTITDELPSNLKQIRCEWVGESGVFNATTGWGGTVNSTQVVVYNVEGLTAPITLRLYTFMRQEEGTLKLTIDATDTNGATIEKRVYNDVPIKNRMVTEYSGRFFSSAESENSFNLTAETGWEVYKQFSF